eukprot:GHVT01095557.1.p1 GENE.GHVT01095557.1~~GHVT01095557.1.p1  ORF type:complete len:226 (+),score=27.85 GHVT01095557.1:3236-3913(+)
MADPSRGAYRGDPSAMPSGSQPAEGVQGNAPYEGLFRGLGCATNQDSDGKDVHRGKRSVQGASGRVTHMDEFGLGCAVWEAEAVHDRQESSSRSAYRGVSNKAAAQSLNARDQIPGAARAPADRPAPQRRRNDSTLVFGDETGTDCWQTEAQRTYGKKNPVPVPSRSAVHPTPARDMDQFDAAPYPPTDAFLDGLDDAALKAYADLHRQRLQDAEAEEHSQRRGR